MVLAVPSSADTINVVALSKCDDDFSDRDVAVLRALRPHLTLGCQTSPDSTVATETAIAGGWVVLTVDASRKVVASSGDAPLVPGDALPDEIELTADDGVGLHDIVVVNFRGESWIMRFMRGGDAPWVLLIQKVSTKNAALEAIYRELGVRNRVEAAALLTPQ